MRKHPRSEDAYKVANLFLEAYKLNNNYDTVDMNVSNIVTRYYDNGCGTIACHAGWYALLKQVGSGWKQREDSDSETYIDDYRDQIYYEEGCSAMACDLLGTSAYYKLQEWAGENPELWGNKYGGEMFNHPCAFFSDETIESFLEDEYFESRSDIGSDADAYDIDCELSLLEVGEWWLGVADRLKAREMTEGEAEEDLDLELGH